MSNQTFEKVEDRDLYIAQSNSEIIDNMSDLFSLDRKNYVIQAVLTTEPVVEIIEYYSKYYKKENFLIYEIIKSTKNCQIFTQCVRIVKLSLIHI